MKIVKITLWALVVLWMVVIFCFSAQTATESSDLSSSFIWQMADKFYDGFSDMTENEKIEFVESLQGIVRTLGHIGEYAILGILVRVALIPYSISLKLLSASLVCFLYGTSDEIHQLFVEGRSFQFTDILCDSFGGICGACFVTLICIICRKIRAKKSRKRLAILD